MPADYAGVKWTLAWARENVVEHDADAGNASQQFFGCAAQYSTLGAYAEHDTSVVRHDRLFAVRPRWRNWRSETLKRHACMSKNEKMCIDQYTVSATVAAIETFMGFNRQQ